MFNETFNAVDKFVNGNQEAPDINGAMLYFSKHDGQYTSKFVVVKFPNWSTVDIEHTKNSFGRSVTVSYTITKDEATELAKFFDTIAKYLG